MKRQVYIIESRPDAGGDWEPTVYICMRRPDVRGALSQLRRATSSLRVEWRGVRYVPAPVRKRGKRDGR